MSASQDKKRRQAEREAGASPKTLAQREAEQKLRKEHRTWTIVGVIVALFIAVINWNDYYNYMMFISNKTNLQPFAWVLRRMLVDQTMMNQVRNGAVGLGMQLPPPMALRMATIICAMVPIMCVYPFLQKYFTSGITLGAIKE